MEPCNALHNNLHNPIFSSRSNYLLASAPFYGSSSLWGICYFFSLLDMEISFLKLTWMFPPAFSRRRGFVSGVERGLCGRSGYELRTWCTHVQTWVGTARENKLVLQALTCIHHHLFVFFVFFLLSVLDYFHSQLFSHSINTLILSSFPSFSVCTSLPCLSLHTGIESRCGVGRMRL